MESVALFSTELEFTIDQVLRRAAIDEDFRDLAVSDPGGALGKFNHRFSGVTRLKFAEEGASKRSGPGERIIFLPPTSASVFQLSDVELEEFVGADCNISCIGNSCEIVSCACTNCCITNC